MVVMHVSSHFGLICFFHPDTHTHRSPHQDRNTRRCGSSWWHVSATALVLVCRKRPVIESGRVCCVHTATRLYSELSLNAAKLAFVKYSPDPQFKLYASFFPHRTLVPNTHGSRAAGVSPFFHSLAHLSHQNCLLNTGYCFFFFFFIFKVPLFYFTGAL